MKFLSNLKVAQENDTSDCFDYRKRLCLKLFRIDNDNLIDVTRFIVQIKMTNDIISLFYFSKIILTKTVRMQQAAAFACGGLKTKFLPIKSQYAVQSITFRNKNITQVLTFTLRSCIINYS